MVKTPEQLDRVLNVRKQRLRMLEFQIQKINAAIASERKFVASLHQTIADSANQPASASSLEARSVWLKQTLSRISRSEEHASELATQQSELETQRQQAEREAEALSTYLTDQKKLRRKEQIRAEQIKLDDLLTQRRSYDSGQESHSA
ncbi:MAG: hypothetical protein AB8G99_06180 [Planctomycetaceae bacterium]